MRKPNLQKLLAKWQKRLRCQDWDCTIGYFSAKELEGSVGQCRMDRKNLQAQIRILDPSDPLEVWQQHFRNVELTLVHELLHITIPAVPQELDEALEGSIEKIAKGLMEL